MQATQVILTTTAQQITFDASLANRWIRFIRISENSRVAYQNAIKQLFKFFAENGITAPCRADVAAWIDALLAAGRSAATVSLYLSAAKRFFGFLETEGLFSNICRDLKTGCRISSAHRRDALTKEQSRDLLESVNGNKIIDLRNKAIIALLLSCGLRTVEIVRADVADLRGDFLRIQGKGHSQKDDVVRIPPQVGKLIRTYLAARRARKGEPLFVSTSRRNFGGRLNTRTIRGLVKDRLRSIGLDSDRLSAHSLRHTCATIALLEGAAVADVQMVLRHRSIATTQVYRHDLDRLKNFAEVLVANVLLGRV